MLIFTSVLTPNEQKLLIFVFIIVVLFILVFAFLGWLGKCAMIQQSKRMEEEMYSIYNSKIIPESKRFGQVAWIKNYRVMFKQFFFPVLIALVTILWVWLYGVFTGDKTIILEFFKYGVGERGFLTLFLILDFANIPSSNFFGLTVWSNFPPVLNTPHFVLSAWPNYITGVLSLASIIWMSVSAQAFIARSFKIRTLRQKAYSINIDDSKTRF
jgi:hypothetical protein